MEIKRGDVILMNLSGKGSEQVGLRPCCVVSNDMNNKYSPVLTIVPLTSKLMKRSLPTHIFLTKEMYPIHTDSVALCEQIITADKTRISGSVLFSLNQLDIRKLDKAIMIQIGLVPSRQNNSIISA